MLLFTSTLFTWQKILALFFGGPLSSLSAWAMLVLGP